MPKTKSVENYFKRYSKFYLQGDSTCWRVEATDSISTPGIFEITAVEYYANEHEDDVALGVVGGLIEKEVDPNTQLPNEIPQIIGETFIKIKTRQKYIFTGNESAEWMVSKKVPVKFEFDNKDPRMVTITWTQSYSGQFDLYYGDHKKTIVVESLF